MNRLFRIALWSFMLLFLFSSCRKKEWDKYYGRPSDLAQPIYRVLQARGNFTHFLACIDKSGYKSNLSSGGYWTIFAPNDSAFAVFFKENAISGDEGIDSALAQKIVRYALVYNAYRKADLSSYQVSGGADTSAAFKRKTAYYNWVYSENGKTVLAANRNGSFDPSDNNNKYIPYFLDKFLSFNGLSAYDYNYFYPQSTYTGFNVAGASVVNADIPAENGLIDEVNRVITPLPNLEEYLAGNDDYSEFRRLLAKVISYQSNGDITLRNQALTGSADSVFIKLYDAGGLLGLAFSPNNENFILSTTDAQTNGWSLVAPTNEALIPYEQKILSHYGTFDAAPPEVLISLLNSLMWTTSIWPSKLAQTVNSEQEAPTFSLSNVVDKKICSNGFFYGVNKVQDANVFRTIYGKAFLDPNYSLMTRALNADIKFSIINPEGHFTMIMMSNKVMNAGGYDFNTNQNSWSYLPAGGTVSYGANPQSRVFRILQTSVFVTQNHELDDLSGEGIVETWDNEYVRYKNNTLFAGGNMDDGTVVHIDSSSTSVNGKVYYVDGLLTFSELSLGAHLKNLAASQPDYYSSFYNYLSNSTLWSASDLSILGTTPGNFYTIFVPTNAAISQAVMDGLLPGNTTTGVPNFKPSNANDQQEVIQFITYHILDKNSVVPDGKKSGAYPTLLKTLNGDLTFINVTNHVNSMQLKDAYGNVANVNVPESNILCDRAVIHSIDKVLNFNAQ